MLFSGSRIGMDDLFARRTEAVQAYGLAAGVSLLLL